MATKVTMPKQGLLMTEGYITKWLISEGDLVTQDEPLFEMETDKLTITIDSPATGILLKIIRGEGETVPVTENIAIIGESGEDISGLLSELEESTESIRNVQQITPEDTLNIKDIPQQTEKSESSKIFVTPRAKMRAQERNINYKDIKGSGPDGLIIERDVLSSDTGKVKTTPVAAKMIQEKKLVTDEIPGTGVSGRVTKKDVLNMLNRGTRDDAEIREQIVPFRGMRKVVSDRMMQSLQNSAQANHRMKVDMTEVIKLRNQLKEANIKVSFNDILIKVVSKALLEFPYMNSSITEEGIVLKKYVNMGLAVSVSNGLLVPNIKDSDILSLAEIAKISSELIKKALEGALLQEEYFGGTFTISNLGMFDIDEFTAIINPPESGILAVGKIEKIPIVHDNNVVIRPITTLSLTYDHRVVDGAHAAQFLQRIKMLLLCPYLLI